MFPGWSDRATQLSTTESQLLGLHNITKQNIGLENKLVELGEQKRKFQTHGQSATHVPISTHHRDLNLILVDQVEIICKILSCSVQPSSSNILANKHHMFQIIIEIA
jgi:hypothetical protein